MLLLFAHQDTILFAQRTGQGTDPGRSKPIHQEGHQIGFPSGESSVPDSVLSSVFETLHQPAYHHPRSVRQNYQLKVIVVYVGHLDRL